MLRINVFNICFMKLVVNFEFEVIFKLLFKGIIVGVLVKKKYWFLFFFIVCLSFKFINILILNVNRFFKNCFFVFVKLLRFLRKYLFEYEKFCSCRNFLIFYFFDLFFLSDWLKGCSCFFLINFIKVR